jgi:hypothetical protein
MASRAIALLFVDKTKTDKTYAEPTMGFPCCQTTPSICKDLRSSSLNIFLSIIKSYFFGFTMGFFLLKLNSISVKALARVYSRGPTKQGKEQKYAQYIKVHELTSSQKQIK